MAEKSKKRLTATIIVIIVESVIILAIGIFGIVYFGPRIMNKVSSIMGNDQYISLGDSISDLPVINLQGEKVEFSDNYKFIIFVSKDCSTCLSHLPSMVRINETFCKDQNVELMLIWRDETPEIEALESYGLENVSYIIEDYSMADSYNTVFLVDSGNNTIFTDTSGYEGIVDKIIELEILDRGKLILNSNSYIQNHLVKNFSGKPDLIYFSMPGCPDCAEANPIVYSEEVMDKAFMTRIELVRGAKEHEMKDDYNFFRKIYSIDWYPSFLVINNDGSWDIVRKVELDNMKQDILSIIK